MRKIADAAELETELRRILVYCSSTPSPSRTTLVQRLDSLRARVAGSPLDDDDVADEEILPVLFVADQSGELDNEVTAVFPTLPGSPGEMLCYAHMGQHGSCSESWLRTTRAATPREYAALKRELESAPYRYQLEVVKRITPSMRSELRARFR